MQKYYIFKGGDSPLYLDGFDDEFTAWNALLSLKQLSTYWKRFDGIDTLKQQGYSVKQLDCKDE